MKVDPSAEANAVNDQGNSKAGASAQIGLLRKKSD